MKHGKYKTRKARKQDIAQSARKQGFRTSYEPGAIPAISDEAPLSLGARALAIVASVFRSKSRDRG